VVRPVLKIVAVLAMALVGALAGTVAGATAGFAYVEIAHTSTFDGERGLTVFFGFVPACALLGAIALPVVYLVMRARQARQMPSADGGGDFTDGEWPG